MTGGGMGMVARLSSCSYDLTRNWRSRGLYWGERFLLGWQLAQNGSFSLTH
jgi:hypothetical protein